MARRRELITGGMLAAFIVPAGALAHHGWVWTEDEDFSLSGVIRSARLGNPHGELDVEADDGMWLCEIGQPGRNARAGLTEELLAPGVEVTLEGHRSRDPAERLMKAERVIIAGKLYNLYPDRS